MLLQPLVVTHWESRVPCLCARARRELLPGDWQKVLDSFQRLLILRCLRADCMVQGLQDFVSEQLGQRFIEPQVESQSVLSLPAPIMHLSNLSKSYSKKKKS